MKLLLNIYIRAFIRLCKSPPHLRVVLNYGKYLIARYRRNIELSYTPPNIVIYTTKNCNLNCSFCFIGDDLNPSNAKEYELSYEDYLKIVENKFFKNSLRVGLLGGEPFIAKDIFRILEDLRKRRKVSTVVTNSTLLKGERLDRFKELAPDILGLSLYDTNREDVRRVYAEMKDKSIIWIQTIIEATSLSYVYDVLEFCIAIGCKNIRFSNYYPTYNQSMEKVIFDDNEDYKILRTNVEKKFGKILNIDWAAPVARKVSSKSCLQPINYVHLDNQGGIGACFMRPPKKEVYGSIFEENAWNNEANIGLRTVMNEPSENCDPTCRYCENLTEDLYKI
ncbi:hypothetical protein BIY24_14775 [Halobacteriovorax marinus]|uniref:radical SAM protein n=1 Tax=Halobacteriovorax marinus TaxID=97084 RepID=UPI000BC3504A|nr:radical SAM protein [Halobacteriovorax marinus]ATH09161.1 hypothetical protein BIY24_14775 [Halobacteriovorax marinus]